MKSRTLVIAMVAAIAVSAIAFLASGDGLGGSIGALGQKAVDGAIGMFVYSNRSDETPAQTAPADQGARLNAAKARAAETAGAMSGGAAQSGGYSADVVQAATESARLASEGSAGIAERTGQAGGTADGTTNSAEPMDVAMLDETVVVETESGVNDAPSASPDAADSPDAGAAMGTITVEPDDAGDAAFDEATDDGWTDSDPFEFEDESVLREMGPGYSRFDGRDPFLALVTTQNQNSAASSSVDPDGLRFVGIIWGSNGICALVEDSQRRGYVLREGDRVLYGRVTSISREVLVIDQVIHGEFKRVTLRLEPYSREGN